MRWLFCIVALFCGLGLIVMPQIRLATTAANVAFAEAIAQSARAHAAVHAPNSSLPPASPIALEVPAFPVWTDQVSMVLGTLVLLSTLVLAACMVTHALPAEGISRTKENAPA